MDQTDQTIDSPPPQPPPTDSVDNDNNANQMTIKEEPLPIQKPLDLSDSCNLNPEFAVICSFIAHFGDKLDLNLNIEQLKSAIEDREYIDESLVDLHVKLIKKIRRYFIRDQWQKALVKFVSEYSYEQADELLTFGYLKTRPSVKLEILRRLIDAQFEHDSKFKAAVNSCEAQELRLSPLGRDIKGNTYWQRTDKEGNFRVFQDEPLDYKKWKTVCSNIEDLDSLIEELDKIKDQRVKGEPFTEPYNPYTEIFSELFTKEEEDQQDQEQQDEIQQTKRRATKGKGRGRGGRGRARKTHVRSTLKDIDEESVEFGHHEESNNLDIGSVSQKQIHLDSLTNTLDQNLISSSNGNIESQVRATIDSLISRVVSSIEYLIRPLSRNSSSGEKKQSEKTNDTPAKSQPKKRYPRKKERPAEELPRRTSSRIQQLQQKKMAEQEDELKKMIDSNNVNNHTSEGNKSESNQIKNRARSESPEQSRKGGRRKRRGESTWRRGKGKKKLSWDRDDSDLSSTSSLTDSNNDEDDLDDEPLQFETQNYDDEFACEEEDTNNEPVIIKRARTARQSLEQSGLGQDESTVIEEDKPCGRCDKSNDPEWILLCDKCDDGYHTACCLPPLMIVPDGDWFCAACEHKMLLQKLSELSVEIKSILEAKERERQKRKRLRQPKSSKEATPLEIDSKRARDVLGELNEPIALQALDDELSENASASPRRTYSRNRKRKRPRKRPNRRRARGSESDEDDDDDDDNFRPSRQPKKSYRNHRKSTSDVEGSNTADDESPSCESEEDEPRPKTRRARASVSYRFKEYDELIKSAIQGDSYEGEIDDRDSDSEHCNYGRGKDMATIEAIAYQQENGLVEPSAELYDGQQDAQQAKCRRVKKKGRRLNDLDADSESGGETSDVSFQASSMTEVDEDEEDEDLTEVDSEDETSLDEILIPTSSRKRPNKKNKRRKRRDDYESDGSDFILPRTTRRAATKKQVNYKESTDEDEEFLNDNGRKRKRTVLESDAETEASWDGSGALREEDADNDEEDDDDDSTSIESPKTDSNEAIIDQGEINRAEEEDVDEEVKTKPSPVPEATTAAGLNESVDELVKLEPKLPPKIQIPIPNPIQPTIQQVPIASAAQPLEKLRDPIQELNQYCLDTVPTQTTMFSSYNETLSSKNLVNSPPRPKFYPDEEASLTGPEVKPRKSKKVKVSPPTNSKNNAAHKTSDTPTKTPNVNHTIVQVQNAKQPVGPAAPLLDAVKPVPRPNLPPLSSPVNLPSRAPLIATPPRYIGPPIGSPMFNMPLQQPLPRQPMPPYNQPMTKPPHHSPSIVTSQSPHLRPQPYPPHFGSPMNHFVGQPRHNVPMSLYSNTPSQAPNLWSPSVISPERAPAIRQSMHPMYYSEAVTNPNFSIQQILGNSYPPSSFAQPTPNLHQIGQQPAPRAPQPAFKMAPLASDLGPAQPPPTNQSNARDSPSGSLDNSSQVADKDMIRGMSDVISFIGDT